MRQAGSQYVMATMNANAEMMTVTNNLLPPGGSYGPWITNDDMGFPDYTMVPYTIMHHLD